MQQNQKIDTVQRLRQCVAGGEIVISDTGNHAVKAYSEGGGIRTVAGGLGSAQGEGAGSKSRCVSWLGLCV